MRYGLGNHSCRRHSSFPSLELVTTSSFSRDLAYHVHPSPWQPYRTSGYMYASTCCAIVPKNGIKNSNTNTTSLATSPSSRCMSIPHMWLSSGAVGSRHRSRVKLEWHNGCVWGTNLAMHWESRLEEQNRRRGGCWTAAATEEVSRKRRQICRCAWAETIRRVTCTIEADTDSIALSQCLDNQHLVR